MIFERIIRKKNTKPYSFLIIFKREEESILTDSSPRHPYNVVFVQNVTKFQGPYHISPKRKNTCKIPTTKNLTVTVFSFNPSS
jgi:hypothetical protein